MLSSIADFLILIQTYLHQTTVVTLVQMGPLENPARDSQPISHNISEFEQITEFTI